MDKFKNLKKREIVLMWIVL